MAFRNAEASTGKFVPYICMSAQIAFCSYRIEIFLTNFLRAQKMAKKGGAIVLRNTDLRR